MGVMSCHNVPGAGRCWAQATYSSLVKGVVSNTSFGGGAPFNRRDGQNLVGVSQNLVDGEAAGT